MAIQQVLMAAAGIFGPRFMDPIVLLGVAAAVVTVLGTGLLVSYAIIAGIMRRWHR